MAPQILHRVIHGRPDPEPWQKALLTFKPAILHRYERHRVRGADYPGIVPESSTGAGKDASNSSNANGPETAIPATDQYVLGTLVSGLTDEDLHRLDIYEGSEYLKKPVKVRVLRETLSVGGRQEASIAKDPDGHLRDVLDAAGAEFADEGEEVDAITYIWAEGMERLERAEWDFESFKRDKMAWWVQADESEW